jgi:acyl-CoA thioesterase II
VEQEALDLSRVFELEPHGPDTFVAESPPYSWGRIYGGLVVAQALWAATQTVRPEHGVHSLHAYFILGGDLGEPVRYEVDRVRNGRSFTTRQVVARQSTGAILTLGCSFQVAEKGAETQSASFPDVPLPAVLDMHLDAGVERCDVPATDGPPRSLIWARFPTTLGQDPRLQACGLAYLSDVNPMNAVSASHPARLQPGEGWGESMMGASLDHAMWFHRPARADDWVLIDMTGHGMIGSRGLATGPVFDAAGAHVATIAQEGLLRMRKKPEAR